MKKTAKKKLVLAKETVRSLEDAALGRTAGGAFVTWDPSCLYYCPEGPNRTA